MDSKKSKILWFSVTTVIFAGLIYFAEPSRFFEAIITAKLRFLIPAFFFGFSIYIVFTNTWHHFLTKVGIKSGYFNSFKLFMSGQFMNSVTPLGQFGGEPFMAYIIKRNTNLSYKEAFSTVLSGDLVNGIPPFTFVIGTAIYLLFFGSLNNIILKTLYAVFLMIAIGVPVIYLIWFKTENIEHIIISAAEKVTRNIGRGEIIVDKLKSKLEGLQEAFDVVGTDPRGVAKTTLIAHFFMVLQVVGLYFVILSLGAEANIAPLFFVVVLSGLANFTPTPGGAGAYEVAMSGLITFFIGLPKSTAITAAILFRLTTYWVGIVIGYFCLVSLEGE